MIFGIGSDIIDIRRVAAVMERTGGRFVEKVLGPEEIAIYEARRARSAVRGLAFLSTRFAAKEAFSKAIGMGMHMPMTWRAVQTLNQPGGGAHREDPWRLARVGRGTGFELSRHPQRRARLCHRLCHRGATRRGTPLESA